MSRLKARIATFELRHYRWLKVSLVGKSCLFICFSHVVCLNYHFNSLQSFILDKSHPVRFYRYHSKGVMVLMPGGWCWCRVLAGISSMVGESPAISERYPVSTVGSSTFRSVGVYLVSSLRRCSYGVITKKPRERPGEWRMKMQGKESKQRQPKLQEHC